MTDNFRNRIVGSGTANPKEIKANPMNWRKHPELQRKAMQDVLDNVGWIQDVIINKTTGRLIDGHLRVETALKNGETEIPVKYVELTEDEEKTALATFDPISAMAEQDEAMFKKLVETAQNYVDEKPFEQEYVPLGKVEEHTEKAINKAVEQAVEQVKKEYAVEEQVSKENRLDSNKYTFAVNIPQYEITGEKPKLNDLYSLSKSGELISKILLSNVDDDEKTFLIEAAKRHTVFNYKNIAEYYAHASKEMQGLMEDSALVIIDVEDAMKDGYARLSQDILNYIEKPERT